MPLPAEDGGNTGGAGDARGLRIIVADGFRDHDVLPLRPFREISDAGEFVGRVIRQSVEVADVRSTVAVGVVRPHTVEARAKRIQRGPRQQEHDGRAPRRPVRPLAAEREPSAGQVVEREAGSDRQGHPRLVVELEHRVHARVEHISDVEELGAEDQQQRGAGKQQGEDHALALGPAVARRQLQHEGEQRPGQHDDEEDVREPPGAAIRYLRRESARLVAEVGAAGRLFEREQEHPRDENQRTGSHCESCRSFRDAIARRQQPRADERQHDHKERTPEQERVERARPGHGDIAVRHDGADAVGLGVTPDRDQERQVRDHRQQQQRNGERARLHEQIDGDRPHPRVVADEGGRHHDEGQRHDVPGVDERQPAYQDRPGDERQRPLQPERYVERFPAPVERQRGGHREQHERQRHHVRVQVAEEEAEHRELGNGPEVLVIERVDARRVEEREESRRIPAVPDLVRGQPGDVDPVVQPLAADAVCRGELEYPDQVAHDDEHEPAGDAECRRPPPEARRSAAHRLLRRRCDGRLAHLHEVVDQARGADERHRRDHRDADVIGDRCRHAGQAAGHGHNQVAEVVVRDGVAAEPRILRREVARAGRRVEEHQVHRLLGAGDLADLRAQEHRRREYGEKQHLDAENVFPVPGQPLEQTVAFTICEGTRNDAQQHQRGDDTAVGVGQNVQAVQQPERIAEEQQGERFGQRVSAVREPAEQSQAERQQDDPHDLEDQPPADGLAHRIPVTHAPGAGGTASRRRNRWTASCSVNAQTPPRTTGRALRRTPRRRRASGLPASHPCR